MHVDSTPIFKLCTVSTYNHDKNVRVKKIEEIIIYYYLISEANYHYQINYHI